MLQQGTYVYEIGTLDISIKSHIHRFLIININ